MKLTESQIQTFHAEGYHMLGDLLSQEETDRMAQVYLDCLIGPNLRIVVCQGMYKPPHTGDEIQWHQDDYYFRVDKINAVVS